MQADEAGVKVIANNNFFANRNGVRPQWIILHGTAGGTSAEAIANYFASTVGTNNPVSSHYVIGQDGEIVQCVSETNGAWANGGITTGHASWWSSSINPNNQTISIEHCKPSTDNSDALTAAQQAASFKLIKDICARWGIPAREANASGGITGHFSMDPVNRTNCPGVYPWADLWAYLKGEESVISNSGTWGPDSEGFAQYFTEDKTTGNWCRKDKPTIVVANANKTLYGQLSFDGKSVPVIGLPTANEVYKTDGSYKYSEQTFERGAIRYDPDHKIDSQPGVTGGSYLMKVETPQPQTVTVTKTVTELPANIKADIAQLNKDASA